MREAVVDGIERVVERAEQFEADEAEELRPELDTQGEDVDVGVDPREDDQDASDPEGGSDRVVGCGVVEEWGPVDQCVLVGVRSCPVIYRMADGAEARRAAGVVSADLREIREMLYQFDRPFVIDSAETTAVFGLTATPLADQIDAIIASHRGERARASSGV